MILRIAKNGLPYHTPPYTKEEVEEFYRRTDGGPVAFTRPGVPLAKPEGTEQEQPPEERPPSSKPQTDQ